MPLLSESAVEVFEPVLQAQANATPWTIEAINPFTGSRPYIEMPIAQARLASNRLGFDFTEVIDFIGVRRYDDQQLEVRGTVLDSAGNPMQRTVVAVSRSGKALDSVRSNVDGTFRIICWNATDRVAIISIPDEGDSRNAVVKWGVLPVVRL